MTSVPPPYFGSTRQPLARPRSTTWGREELLSSLAVCLEGSARCVTLTGTGGIGKSRLAAELAYRVEEEFPGGVVWATLEGCRSSAELWQSVLLALDEPELASGASARRIAEVLSHREPLLMVLDNLEQVVEEAAPAVDLWLDTAPDVVILSTSRRALAIDGERVFPVPPLSSEAALEMLRSALDSTAAGGDLPDPALESLVEALDGVPLAIELATSRLSVLSPLELVNRIRTDTAAVADTRRGQSRHATLRRTILSSYELLSSDERAAFCQLAVFPHVFDGGAAEAVIEAGGASLDLFQSLCHQSLVFRQPGRGAPRFRLLLTLRVFASEQLDSEVRAAAELRHALHYLERYSGGDLLNELEEDLPHLLRVLERFALGQPTLAARAAKILDPYWFARASPERHAAALRAVRQALPVESIELRQELQACEARACAVAGGLDEAELLLEFEPASPEVGAERHIQRGLVQRLRGNYALALTEYERAGALRSTALGNAALARHVAVTHLLVGELERAEAALENARRVYEELAADGLSATVLCDLGVVCLERGRDERAVELLQRAADHYQRRGDRRGLGVALSNLGVVDHQRGELAASREHFDRALRHHRRVGNHRFAAFTVGCLAALDWEEGEWERAREAAEWTLSEFGRLSDDRFKGWAAARLGGMLRLLGDTDACPASFATARTSWQGTDPSWWSGALAILEGAQAAASADARPRSAERIARRLTGAVNSQRSRADADKSPLTVAADGSWFCVDGGERVDLRRRRVVRGLLSVLAAAHEEGTPYTVEQLVLAGWPGQRMRASSAASRVYVAVQVLRDLGLRDCLIKRRDGYLLVGAVRVVA